jgi:hypothetical protein
MSLPAALAAAILVAWVVWRVRLALFEDTTWALLVSRVPWDVEPLTPDLPPLPDGIRCYFQSVLREQGASRTVFEAFVRVESGARFDGLAEVASAELHQVVAAPHGAMWKLRRAGLTRASAGVTARRDWAGARFLGLLPRRLSVSKATLYAEMLLEAALWSPASLVKAGGKRWTGEGELAIGGIACEGVDFLVWLTIGPAGRLSEVRVSCERDEEAILSAVIHSYGKYDGTWLPQRVAVRRRPSGAGYTLQLLQLRYPEVWSSPRRG